MVEIGPERFCSMCSDDTGSTHNARGFAQDKFAWLLNVPDPCHGMSNLIKDITALVQFKPVSRNEPITVNETYWPFHR